MKKSSTRRSSAGLFDLALSPAATGPHLSRTRRAALTASPVWDAALTQSGSPARPYRHGAKRLLDVALIVASLPFWLPLVLLCALALWIEGGQPFYRQERLGRDGRRFSILKLRTMVRDADQMLADLCAKDPEIRAEWETLQKLRNDPRITPIGRLLRAASLDELPQLLNVLRGDMSLVGPRPMLPEQLSLYGDPRAYFALRPGLTGLWQVSARNNNRFTYRHGVDEAYENALSFKLDLIVLWKTVGVVLRRTGW